jgi:pyruvate,water dikinase
VTTVAYQHFVAENALQNSIMNALAEVDETRPGTLEAASAEIQALFAAAEIPPAIAGSIVQAYAALPGSDPPVAVRSSATAEDLPEASFAGQQETYLNVSGAEQLLAATKRCWASLWTARAIGYRLRQEISAEQVALAVVVQLLVPAEVAGILFTANPVNGDRNQAVISASWGLGESVVGGQVTPDNVIVDKETGRVVNYTTADKQVMTVRIKGGTQEQPVPENLRQVPVLNETAAAELTRLGAKIESLYGRPMDVEWTLADNQFAIVQARPITALPDAGMPQLPAPTEWPMPDPKGQYFRGSVIDFLPDPLSPLFETMGLRAHSASMNWLLAEFVNVHDALTEDLLLAINGYAYMQMRFSKRTWFIMLGRLLPAIPRLMREGLSYWREIALPRYAGIVKQWEAKAIDQCTAGELLAGARVIVAAVTQHLATLQISTLGSGGGTEILFTKVYEKLVQKSGDPPPPTFLLGYDSLPILSEKALFDLAQWSGGQDELANYLRQTTAEKVYAQMLVEEVPAGIATEVWREWQQRFQAYLQRHGYSIYDLDFAKPLPLDDPTPMLETIKMYLAGEGKNPYARQRALAERREAAMQVMTQRLGGFKRWAFFKTLGWAQAVVPAREDSIAEIGRGYPVLREILVELGSRLVNAGMIAEVNDIYWLEEREIDMAVVALEQGDSLSGRHEDVHHRQALWQARRQVTPPPQLPPKAKYFGIDMEQYLAGGAGAEGEALKGVPASPGKVTGRARVLYGPEDFDEMEPGDVLVAAITTPAWTPLFAMAAAIVTDVGGPLSHGSIVAREYGIPAVLGTGLATRRIQSGQLITVDGSAGTVSLANGQRPA